ncbi:MAG: M28 family peptidase, partial [Candidatus Hadarchaeota archaeon]|nr:M28 family peptidase [Candidatus Hadarchaeota archaeon]
MSPFEPRLAFEHLDKLAYEIGPRLAGSRGEKLAEKYIRCHLKSLGLRVSVQRFDFVSIISKMRAASVILAGAFITTLFLPALLALTVGVSGVALVLALPHLLPKHNSLNIIGELKPRRPKKHVLITAHYDSAPCTRGRRLTIYLRLTLVPLVAVFLLLLALRAAGLLPAWPVVWTGLAAIFLPMCGVLFIARKGQVSPGANDNASGVAVMLEAARAAAEDPPPDLELDFVALGAEEQGLVGSRR